MGGIPLGDCMARLARIPVNGRINPSNKESIGQSPSGEGLEQSPLAAAFDAGPSETRRSAA